MPAQSFVDFLSEYGDAHQPSLVYQEGEDFPAWQQRFHDQLGALQGALPDRVDPEIEILESSKAPGHTRHLVRIAVSPISSLPAYLLVPSRLPAGERRPGLVAVQGHYRHGIDSICGVRVDDADPDEDLRHAYALHAVRAGYVVMVPALWGWHGRDQHLDLVGERDRCNVIQMAASMYGINVVDLHVQDCQAALDALCTRPDVDAGRLGALGNSYGGRMVMWLAVRDQRLDATVASGCMNTFRERSQKLSSCGIQYPFGLLQYGDVPEVLSLIAPRPLQVQSGEGDGLITPSDRAHIAAALRQAYELSGASSSFQHHHHDQGHLLLWEPAQRFLDSHLGDLDTDLGDEAD